MKNNRTFKSAVIFCDVYHGRIDDFLSPGFTNAVSVVIIYVPFRPQFTCGLAFLVGA
ncbi:hypothetical protein HMPREF9996_01039 [Aggregatibacter actinomycetemcomitans Y4]|nr:hypothetical protein HMPREF9996_01039 [Aggregatibacter actinomycetemcomitans Y4]